MSRPLLIPVDELKLHHLILVMSFMSCRFRLIDHYFLAATLTFCHDKIPKCVLFFFYIWGKFHLAIKYICGVMFWWYISVLSIEVNNFQGNNYFCQFFYSSRKRGNLETLIDLYSVRRSPRGGS